MTEPPSGNSKGSTGALLLRFTDQVKGLFKAEIALAKLELAEKGKRLGVGIGLLAAAGFLALYGLAALLASAGLALALVFDGWLAGLILSGGIFFLVGVLALVGIKRVQRGTPPIPTDAIDGAKKDLAAARGRQIP